MIESPCLDVSYPTREAVNDRPKETPGSEDAVEYQAQVGPANEQNRRKLEKLKENQLGSQEPLYCLPMISWEHPGKV